eukprot:5523874-Pleurochrysis_carterae.AAC.2
MCIRVRGRMHRASNCVLRRCAAQEARSGSIGVRSMARGESTAQHVPNAKNETANMLVAGVFAVVLASGGDA